MHPGDGHSTPAERRDPAGAGREPSPGRGGGGGVPPAGLERYRYRRPAARLPDVPVSRVEAPQPHGTGPIHPDGGARPPHPPPPHPEPLPAGAGPRSRRLRPGSHAAAPRWGHAGRTEGRRRDTAEGTRRTEGDGATPVPTPAPPTPDRPAAPSPGRAGPGGQQGYIVSTGGAAPSRASYPISAVTASSTPRVLSNQRRRRFRSARRVQSAAAPLRRGGRKSERTGGREGAVPVRVMADPEEGSEDGFYQRFADELEVLAELGGGSCSGAVSGTGGGGRRREGAAGLCAEPPVPRSTVGLPR